MSRRRIPYSDAEMRWLEVNRMMILSDYHSAFCNAFGRVDVSIDNLKALRTRMGWKVGRAPGRFAGRHLRYSAAEIRWLGDNCTMERADFHRAFCAQFDRSDVSAQMLVALRKREGWRTGRSGRFERGTVPANKGKKMPFNANSARTYFKKGQQPHNTKHAGAEYVDAQSGHVWISINEVNPRTGFERRYVQKHRLLWEQANGPIPDGSVLKCLGEKTNCDPSNWELIPRAFLPRLNGKSARNFDTAPAELKPIIMTVAKIEHAVRKRARQLSNSQRENGAHD